MIRFLHRMCDAVERRFNVDGPTVVVFVIIMVAVWLGAMIGKHLL